MSSERARDRDLDRRRLALARRFPGATIVRHEHFGARWTAEWDSVEVTFDEDDLPKVDLGAPWSGGRPYYVVSSTATRHAPYGQSTRGSQAQGPVLHRTRRVVLRWTGYGQDHRYRPGYRCEWWCGGSSGYGILLTAEMVVGRHVCAKCEGYALAFGEPRSGLTLRQPRERRRR